MWSLSTVQVPSGSRYLLPGPKEAFQKGSTIKLNPSYLAPYAFRLFAQVDRDRDWLSLVKSSYQVLENTAQLSAVKLPSDWVALDTQSGQFQALPPSSPIKTLYRFDAYRVWWRMATERVQKLRVEYWEKIKHIEPENLVFLDETGILLGLTRTHARSYPGTRVTELKPFYPCR